MARRLSGIALAFLLASPTLGGQPAAAPVASPEAASPAPAPASPTSPPVSYDSPWRAYEEGAYDQALEGFVDRQVARPEDPALAFNVGDAHYKMRNWEEAERAFARAAVAAEPELRAASLYNLGNVAYRQGKLEEAVERYKAALEVDPDDEDAKFNLEFVRDEIRRRHEEAKKRQEQQQDQQQQQQQQQQEGQQQQDESSSDEQQPQDESQPQESGESGDSQEQPPQQPDEPGGSSGPDGDQDGLPDQLERDADNPTDPENPDTDGDGLPDGAEDIDRDGQVGPGETDPNNPDTDGDGTPDGAERQAGTQAAGEAAPADGLTPEEAARYLQALREGRPEQRRGQPGRRTRPEKDW